MHQIVISAAGKHPCGDTIHKSLEDNAVVIIHIVDNGEIQMDAMVIHAGFQVCIEPFQFSNGLFCFFIAAKGFCFWQDFCQTAMEGCQCLQTPCKFFRNTVFLANLCNTMGIFFTDADQNFLLLGRRKCRFFQ